MRYTGKQLRRSIEVLNEQFSDRGYEWYVIERDGLIYPGRKWGAVLRRKDTHEVLAESNYGHPIEVSNWVYETCMDILYARGAISS